MNFGITLNPNPLWLSHSRLLWHSHLWLCAYRLDSNLHRKSRSSLN